MGKPKYHPRRCKHCGHKLFKGTTRSVHSKSDDKFFGGSSRQGERYWGCHNCGWKFYPERKNQAVAVN